MKKSINILGIIFLIILVMGIIFKRLHWPGAGILLTLGIFLFVVVFLPAFILSLRKQLLTTGNKRSSLFVILGFSGIAIISFGILSKIMHWPGAGYNLVGGAALLSFVLIIFILFQWKTREKISMISVLIVIIILGSFSFNTFRTSNIRSLQDANQFTTESFKQYSIITWNECENIISALPAANNGEVLKLHLLTQETDLLIGGIIEKIKVEENPGIYHYSAEKNNSMLRERLSEIIMNEDCLPSFDRKMTEYKLYIQSLTSLNESQKLKLIENLSYPFDIENLSLVYKYTGIMEFENQTLINSLYIWKSKIWETEYEILNIKNKS